MTRPMPNLGLMAIDAIQPALYPVTSAPGATPAIRATVATEKAAEETTLLAEPPADAIAAVQVASEAYEVLRQSGRELRFEKANGILRIEVYDGTGRLVREIPPTEALALASREASWQA
jgi:uncharacterized FlaG/YvyC family protein